MAEDSVKSDGNIPCALCERKVKTHRIAQEDLCWIDSQGNETGIGKVRLTLFGDSGPLCRRCFISSLDFLKEQIKSGGALIPVTNRTKRFKVIQGGKV